MRLDDLAPLFGACEEMQVGGMLGEIMGGGDSLLAHLKFDGGPHQIARHLQPHLDRAPFEDWCVVEIGGRASWPSKYAERSDDDMIAEPSEFGASVDVGRHRSAVNCYDAKGLFILLKRDIQLRQDRPGGFGRSTRSEGAKDPLLEGLSRRLGGLQHRLWHGRSSILIAFHDPRETDLIAGKLAYQLDDKDVLDWCIFEIGPRSAEKADLDRMERFIAANFALARSKRPARGEPHRREVPGGLLR